MGINASKKVSMLLTEIGMNKTFQTWVWLNRDASCAAFQVNSQWVEVLTQDAQLLRGLEVGWCVNSAPL